MRAAVAALGGRMRLLRLSEVMERTGLGRSTLYRLEAVGRFPSRRQVGDRAVAWLDSEVDAWISGLPVAPQGAATDPLGAATDPLGAATAEVPR